MSDSLSLTPKKNQVTDKESEYFLHNDADKN